MTSLQNIVKKTEQLKALLELVTRKNRLEMIKEINQLLDERELLLKQLDTTNIKENHIVQSLRLEEPQIKIKMQQILVDIKKDLQMVRKKRKTGENYINPYQSLRVDGVFFDKKK